MKSVIIVAGGSSVRYGSDKLSEKLFDVTILEHSVNAFKEIVDEIIVAGVHIVGTKFACGGKTRQESVANGLSQLDENCTVVAIHDGARPFVSRELVCKLFDCAEQHGSAVPCLPVSDTLWNQKQPVNRQEFFTVQTPQVFDCKKLKKAFQNCKNGYTDESSLFYDYYGKVNFVSGEPSNKKITYVGDVPQYKVGQGFDVHAFESGNGVILGGVTIPFDKKLKGHSDADVLAHAICDAVLSASNNLDIGHQFPDTDPKYLGADSLELLSKCVALAKNNGYAVVNVSAVVVCQAPKIAPYIEQIKQKLSLVLGVCTDCVNISATTTEHLGALGNGDGIACTADALLIKTAPLVD